MQRALDVKHKIAETYHPRANGQTERYNQHYLWCSDRSLRMAWRTVTFMLMRWRMLKATKYTLQQDVPPGSWFNPCPQCLALKDYHPPTGEVRYTRPLADKTGGAYWGRRHAPQKMQQRYKRNFDRQTSAVENTSKKGIYILTFREILWNKSTFLY